MRKIKLYIAESLDGFIATTNGKVDWLFDTNKQDVDINAYGYLDFYHSIDTTLMGHKTYEEILKFDVPFPYMDKKNYVFSRKNIAKDENPVEFVSSDIIEFVSHLKIQQGKDIWLIGGSEINKQLLNASLIDEVIVTIIPVVLGEGIQLFARGTEQTRFNISNVKTFDGSIVQITLNTK